MLLQVNKIAKLLILLPTTIVLLYISMVVDANSIWYYLQNSELVLASIYSLVRAFCSSLSPYVFLLFRFLADQLPKQAL